MTDRIARERARRRARGVFGTLAALAASLTAASAAVAAETPNAPTTQTPAPAPASSTPAPAPALPVPPQPKPATDDDADQPAAPNAPAPTSDASPAAPAPIASPDTPMPAPPSTARAVAEPDLNSVDDGTLGTHQEHWLLGIGVREMFVTEKAYDPFSTDNVLPQVSLNLGRAFYASGPLSFAGLFVWDYGSTKATARGADASLAVHRLTAAAEARYHLFRRWYVFGRVAPGALHSAATLHDQVVGVDRESNAWVFTSDFSAGSAFEFAGDARGASTRPRAWIGADAGYSWAESAKLDFKATGADSSTPARLEPLSFGELAVRGAFLRFTATLTY
ncbi:MAG TPA: hypothetical protein VMI54_27480 [Polyangiaceae bacterium]|nr:hypothetical protein [Polyangiaceae bacterium]